MKKTLASSLIISVVLLLSPVSVFADATITTGDNLTTQLSLGDCDSCEDAAFAQSFLTTQAGTISSVQIGIWAAGSPAGNLTITLEADSGGNPSGTPLATATVAASSISTTKQRNTFTFSSSATVTNATTYWIKAARDTWNASNYFELGANTTNFYADGGVKRYNSGTSLWSAINNYDMNTTFVIVDAATPAVIKPPDIIWFD